MQSSPNSKGDEKFNQSKMQGKVLINIHLPRSQTPSSSEQQDGAPNDLIKSDINEREDYIPYLHLGSYCFMQPVNAVKEITKNLHGYEGKIQKKDTLSCQAT